MTGDGVVKILDFGLAKIAGPEATVTPDATTVAPQTERGTVLGTMGYTAPEQLCGEPADVRSDIFALGCVLYELLSGKSPFRKATGAETITAIMSADPPPLSASGRAVATALIEIVNRCLEKRPEERFSSAHDLALALRACLGASEIPAAASVPARKAARSRAFVGLAVVVIVVAAIGGWTLFSRRKASPPAARPPLRIVVLPFENLGSSDDAYFASGMTEELTSRLSNVRNLAVISRTSATGYDRKGRTIEQIGKDLGVAYVLEGSVRWDRSAGGPGRVRITPQLIRVSDDTHLWSERYDRQLADIFAIQGDVADGVVQALHLTLAPSESTALRQLPTRDLEAYDSYLRALELEKRSERRSAIAQQIDLTSQAVGRDPQFAEAFALLAKARIMNHFLYYDRRPSELERARIEAERSVALRPDSADSHLALGYYLYQGRLDYDAALAELNKALAFQPNNARVQAVIAFVKRRQGRMDEAEADLRIAINGDPRNGYLYSNLGATQSSSHKYAEAIRNYEMWASLEPNDAVAYRDWAWEIVRWHGDVAAAEQVLRKAAERPVLEDPYRTVDRCFVQTGLIAREWEGALRRLNSLPEEPEPSQRAYAPTSLHRGHVLSYMGRWDLARESYEEARRHLTMKLAETPDDARLHTSLGIALAGLGRIAEAVQEGERGVALMPPDRDALRGGFRVEDLALIYTMAGRQDAAIQRLDYLLSHPSWISFSLVKLDPRWDPLRKNPNFQALLAKYEAKQ